MRTIPIGTCVPGDRALAWGPHLLRAGYECLSVNFHMAYDQGDLSEYARRVREMATEQGAFISAVGYYCNPLENAEQLGQLEAFIDHAREFGADIVSTFAGALPGQDVPASMPGFARVFGELARRAEDRGVRIAFENCPMGGTWQQPTCNIAFSPSAWELMFDAVPSANLGLEWEPAHQLCQLIDPIEQLPQWLPRIFHVHGKDAQVDEAMLRKYGTLSGREYVVSRTPGFGQTDWRQVFTSLYMGGYAGCISVEGYHDPIYGGDWEMDGQLHALHYLNWCRGGAHTPNPW